MFTLNWVIGKKFVFSNGQLGTVSNIKGDVISLKSEDNKSIHFVDSTGQANIKPFTDDNYSVLCEYKGIYNDTMYVNRDATSPDYMKTSDKPFIEMKAEHTAPIGGTKHDSGKPMFSCLPPDALLELGKVAEVGARKYGLHNYRSGIAVSRTLDAAFRHLIKAISGEDDDPIDHNNHLASAAWNLLVALQTLKDRPDLDDRYKKD